MKGTCIKDKLECDGDCLICHLNPSVGEQTEEGKPFPNRKCSNFIKGEVK